MKTRRPDAYRVITHLHSQASDGAASPLYPFVLNALARSIGMEQALKVNWKECLISFETLEKAASGELFPIDVMCITDHVSLRAHRVHKRNIEIALQNPKVIIGSEVSLVACSGKGEWLVAPEILLYGPTWHRQTDDGSRYFGVTQEDLDDLYATCTPEGAPEPEIHRVIEWVEERGYAWAIPHPMDGNALDLTDLLPILHKARAIETLNGGFPATAYRVLTAYVTLHNAFHSKPDRTDWPLGDTLMQRRLARLMRKQPHHGMVPLGAADSHLRDLDRVVTWMRPTDPTDMRAPAELFLSAIRQGQDGEAHFETEGESTSWVRLHAEAGRIALTNLVKNRRFLKGKWRKTLRITAETIHERMTTFESRNADKLRLFDRMPWVEAFWAAPKAFDLPLPKTMRKPRIPALKLLPSSLGKRR